MTRSQSITVRSKSKAMLSREQKRTRKVAKAVATLAASTSSVSKASAAAFTTTSPYFSSTPKNHRSPFYTTALSSKTPGKKKNPPGKKKQIERTHSFEPVWAGTLLDLVDCDIEPHTLILGTHPSIKSLEEEQYYGHQQNAFWWIAGDCLGFRRASAVSPSTGKPYKFSSSLRYDESHIVPYNDQLQIMVKNGFALWDVIGSCNREGSLDSAIKNEIPNDIRGFCERHASVKRIVLSNGSTGSQLFAKSNMDWWLSGELKPGTNVQSQNAFGRFAKQTNDFKDAKITCITALGVSPAAARFSYEQKREFWEEYVYKPGLQDFEAQQSPL